MRKTTLPQYTVLADADTGEWLEEPTYVGEVDRAAWNAKPDTTERHFDTYEAGDPLQSETRAIEVVWQ